jgi:hypothetical protein
LSAVAVSAIGSFISNAAIFSTFDRQGDALLVCASSVSSCIESCQGKGKAVFTKLKKNFSFISRNN